MTQFQVAVYLGCISQIKVSTFDFDLRELKFWKRAGFVLPGHSLISIIAITIIIIIIKPTLV